MMAVFGTAILRLARSDTQRALRLAWSDYEDCLIALAAEKVKADYLVTRDKAGFARSAVPTATPEEVLSFLLQQYGLEYDGIG